MQELHVVVGSAKVDVAPNVRLERPTFGLQLECTGLQGNGVVVTIPITIPAYEVVYTMYMRWTYNSARYADITCSSQYKVSESPQRVFSCSICTLASAFMYRYVAVLHGQNLQ